MENFGGLALTIFSAFSLLIHIVLAFSVFFEAERTRRTYRKPLYLMGPTLWFFVILGTGMIGVFVFWFMHHFAPREETRGSALKP